MWMVWLAMSTGWAVEPTCEEVALADVLAVPPPAILVLGERFGTQPDLRRARQIVYRLAKRSSVTLALEAVPHTHQQVLNRYAKGEIDPEVLPDELAWGHFTDFPWEPYQSLVGAASEGAHVLAIGGVQNLPPDDRDVPVPGGYSGILRDAMSPHEMPFELQASFARTMAWQDLRLAERALSGWNERGYLILIVGREHVEGGRGVPWQLSLATDVPVHPFVLSWADPPCYPGDRVWRRSLLDRWIKNP